MFGIGMPELILLFLLALLIFGPKKLPEIGKQLGRALGELRRASEDLKEGWAAEVAAVDERPASQQTAPPPEPPPASPPPSPEASAPAPEPAAGEGKRPPEA